MLSRSDEFVSVARGRWGLAEWYPGRALKKRKGKNGEQSPEEKLSGADKPAENPKSEETNENLISPGVHAHRRGGQ